MVVLHFIKIKQKRESGKDNVMYITNSTCYNTARQYLTRRLGSPNLFFLHAVIPWYRPIKALDSSVIASSPNA